MLRLLAIVARVAYGRPISTSFHKAYLLTYLDVASADTPPDSWSDHSSPVVACPSFVAVAAAAVVEAFAVASASRTAPLAACSGLEAGQRTTDAAEPRPRYICSQEPFAASSAVVVLLEDLPAAREVVGLEEDIVGSYPCIRGTRQSLARYGRWECP